MGGETVRAVIAVFDTVERAERAVATLLVDRFHPDQVVLINGDTVGAVEGVLDGTDTPRERISYYASEVRGGRALVVVCCAPEDASDATTALARHGGSVCVPPEVRDGRA